MSTDPKSASSSPLTVASAHFQPCYTVVVLWFLTYGWMRYAIRSIHGYATKRQSLKLALLLLALLLEHHSRTHTLFFIMNAQTPKPAVGQPIPELSITLTNGESVALGQPAAHWQLLVVYRGKHCPRCKRYLNTLQSMLGDWEAAGLQVLALSADTLERATADIQEFGWTFPVGYGLSETDMRRLGLYITEPLSPDEAPARFAEPGIFCIKPDATIQIAAISNGPAARPDLAELLDGMKFNITNNRPTRGTVI